MFIVATLLLCLLAFIVDFTDVNQHPRRAPQVCDL
jgi:Flp pilus assembly protein TadG